MFLVLFDLLLFFFFKQKTAYEMRISDWSSDVCSSDLYRAQAQQARAQIAATLAGADTIRSQVTEQDSSIRQARAQLAAKRAALDLAKEQQARDRPLAATGAEPRGQPQPEQPSGGWGKSGSGSVDQGGCSHHKKKKSKK